MDTFDLGLLLATIATAAAALVAIVGGLLVSRVVSLASERSGLIHRRDDLRGQLQTEEARCHDLERLLLDSDARYVLRPKYEALARADVQVDLEAWIAEAEVDRSVDEIQPYLEREQALFAAARGTLEAFFDQFGVPDYDFDTLVEAGVAKLPPGHRAIYDIVFDQLIEERSEPTPPADDYAERLRQAALSAYSTTPIYFSVSDHQHHAHLEREIDQSVHRIAALEVQVEQALTALARVTRPAGVRAGVYVLAYFGGVGTLVPLAMMMVERHLAWAAGWVAITLFASGLAALLGYVIWQANHLTDDRAAEPAEETTTDAAAS